MSKTLETRRIEACVLDTLERSGLTADEVHGPESVLARSKSASER